MKILFLIIFFIPVFVFSQQLFLPLNQNTSKDVNRQINYTEENIHTGFRPLLESNINNFFNVDSVLYKTGDIDNKRRSWFWRKLRTEDFILVDTTDFFLAINPMINIEQGKDLLTDSLIRINTRGIAVKGNIGKTLSFYSDFYENQAFFPDYIHKYILEYSVIPGQGRNRAFKTYGHDYAFASGYLSFSPKKWLNFQTGHYKNFVGEGYRSLLLSDFSFNYPFVKTTVTLNKFQYTSMFTSHQEIKNADSRLLAYQRKHGSFNYLNWIVNKNMQIGLFEGIMWRTTYENTNNKFSPNYFNPVIMIRPLQYGLGNENNIILGLNSKIRIIKNIQMYGQFVLDDFSNEYTGAKYGYQAGIKLFEIFKIKNLYLQAEFNSVSPYTYGHSNVFQNYSNANEQLAHPLGANFKEFISIASYKIKDFFLNIKYINSGIITSVNGFHCGNNIFLSDTLACELTNTNNIVRYTNSKLTYFSCYFGYTINYRYNMQIFAGYINRKFINNFEETKTEYITLGIKAYMHNQYYDF